MTKTTRARYTLEFKHEAVRLVEGGQSQAAVAKTLGLVEQTLFNWVKAIAPNRLDRQFTVDAPNKVWTGDITVSGNSAALLPTRHRWRTGPSAAGYPRSVASTGAG